MKDECHIVHIGSKFQDFEYKMARDSAETVLQVSDTEKDPGVWVDNKLRFEQHTERAASKAS